MYLPREKRQKEGTKIKEKKVRDPDLFLLEETGLRLLGLPESLLEKDLERDLESDAEPEEEEDEEEASPEDGDGKSEKPKVPKEPSTLTTFSAEEIEHRALQAAILQEWEIFRTKQSSIKF